MPRLNMSRSGASQALDEFRIHEERPDTATVILAIHGDADLRVAGELEDRLGSVIDEGPPALVVDLSGTKFLDSMALGILLDGMKRLRDKGGRFRVVAPGVEVRRIFEITLLDRIFELDTSRDEALAATGARRARARGGGDG